MALVVSKDEAEKYVGQEVGVSDWLRIEQERINAFADATNDHQFIHVESEAAAESPFGTTIAHGFLTVSLLTDLAGTNGIQLDNTELVINYGMNKLRFLAPVKVNDEIRARIVLNDFEEKRPKQFLITTEVTVEIKGEDKPALVVEWLTMSITN